MKYQVAIIGGGPAGYTAAEAAGKAGLSVVLFEKQSLGGVCLNEGCIPTKTLLYSAKTYDGARHAAKYAVSVPEVSFDLPKIIARKQKVVRKLVLGVKGKLTAHGVTIVSGGATVTDKNHVECGGETYECDNLLLCTGSETFVPAIPGIDKVSYWTHRDALDNKELPASLAIIGGGVIGVEIATIFAALGSRVTLLEQANRLLESMDPMISEQMEANLRSKGIEVHCNVQVMEIKDRGNDTVSVNYRCERGWKESPADRVLVAVGRRPNMSKVLADDCQVQLENGRPLIKGTYRTTQENVYAIGDTVARKRLAHVAASHAAYLVENLAGRGHRMQLSVVPNGMYVVLPVVPTCIYTEPEIAAVGFTENDARLYNMKIKCGVAYMTENGKALLARNSRGFVRLIFEAYTNTLIGAQIMCARATDMIGEMATAIANGLTAYQLSTAMRAHPTYSEAITEAIKDALKNG